MSHVLQCEGIDTRATLVFPAEQGSEAMAAAAAMARAEAEHLRDEVSPVWETAEAKADELDELADTLDVLRKAGNVAWVDHAAWAPPHMDQVHLRLWTSMESAASKH